MSSASSLQIEQPRRMNNSTIWSQVNETIASLVSIDDDSSFSSRISGKIRISGNFCFVGELRNKFKKSRDKGQKVEGEKP